MMIGPDPMMSTFLMSFLSGMFYLLKTRVHCFIRTIIYCLTPSGKEKYLKN